MGVCPLSYQEVVGNLFDAETDALVNTVNCYGAMGKGIALEFRRRFPEMFEVYCQLCEAKRLRPGQIWPYTKTHPYILNFAIKDHWRLPSKLEWIEATLCKFVANYRRLGIRSVAFPWMGAMNGGLAIEDVKELMRQYLQPITDCDIIVYTYDPNAPDPLYRILVKYLKNHSGTDLHKQSGLIKKQAIAVVDAIHDDSTMSMVTLIKNAQLGAKSIDKLYVFLAKSPDNPSRATEDLKLEL